MANEVKIAKLIDSLGAKEALAGKFNASRKEIVNAYNQMKATDDYKTNLLFRNFVNDLYQSAISE